MDPRTRPFRWNDYEIGWFGQGYKVAKIRWATGFDLYLNYHPEMGVWAIANGDCQDQIKRAIAPSVKCDCGHIISQW